MTAEGSAFSFPDIYRVVAQGQFVFSISECKAGTTPEAFLNHRRVETGMIVERWNTIASNPIGWVRDKSPGIQEHCG